MSLDHQPAAFSVCVYCGARAGADPDHARQARSFGAGLAARGWRLVYGAGDAGLMGAAARACIEAGGEALGIIPAHLIGVEAKPGPRHDVLITETMHERKKVMIFNAQAVVVLPGGIGSLDEFFEALTWRALGLHAKPILLVGAAYWAPLVALIEHVIASGFADPALRDAYEIADDAQAALARLEQIA